MEYTLKCSHLFNILDASNSIGVTERTNYILRVRQLAVRLAKSYVDDMEGRGAEAVKSATVS
jgi:glycyl-tRNA synthetase alpha chain